MHATRIITPEHVIEMLSRYVQPWTDPAAFSLALSSIDIRQAGLDNPDAPTLRAAPVSLRYKSVVQPGASSPIVKQIQKMAVLPQFYRLNHIRQLANTHLAVNLEGSHNRLSHSLGTLDVAACFVDSIEESLGNKLPPADVKAVLVYAFVHDCFHGPMGHTLDLIRDLFWGIRAGERVDKYLLKKYVASKSGFLWNAVRTFVASSDKECTEIFDTLYAFLSSAAALGDKSYLAEIVDSELDSDRIDYLWRDHIHLEMKDFEKSATEIRALIGSACPIREQIMIPTYGVRFGDVEEQPKTETHLYFGYEYANEMVRNLLEKRVEFYRKYYEHPTKLIADEMLIHAIFYAMRDANVFGPDGAADGVADRFSFLTDDGLLAFLGELTSLPGLEIPRFLVQDFRANRNFSVLYKRGIPRAKFHDLSERYKVVQGRLGLFEAQHWPEVEHANSVSPAALVGDKEYAALVMDLDRIVREDIVIDPQQELVTGRAPRMGDRLLKYDEDYDIFHLQFLYGRGFVKRAKLEMLLWSELCKDKIFGKSLVNLADRVAKAAGATVEGFSNSFGGRRWFSLVLVGLPQ